MRIGALDTSRQDYSAFEITCNPTVLRAASRHVLQRPVTLRWHALPVVRALPIALDDELKIEAAKQGGPRATSTIPAESELTTPRSNLRSYVVISTADDMDREASSNRRLTPFAFP